jgi:cytochrome c oxidase assembly factor CtaG
MDLVVAHVGGPILAPLQATGVVVLAFMYLRRAATLAARGTPVPTWRLVCFLTGLILIIAAYVSPLDHISEELLLAHMIQHLVIGDVAALLIVLGLTGPLLQPILAIEFFSKLRFLAHPFVALPLWGLNLYVWHLPVLYEGVLASPSLHVLQHLCFVGFGVLMWMPLFGPLPKPSWFNLPAKIGYLIAVRLLGTVLGNVFLWADTDFYPVYSEGREYWGISALADQGTAGTIMLTEQGLVTFAVLAWLFLEWARQDTERQRLLDLADREGVELDVERAERAVAAGSSKRLEDRLRGDAP